MGIRVYAKCLQCGIEGRQIRELLAKHPDAELIKSSEYSNKEAATEKIKIQMMMGLPNTHYYGLVVRYDDTGAVVEAMSIRDWSSRAIG